MFEKCREHKKAFILIAVLLILAVGFGCYEYRSRKAGVKPKNPLNLLNPHVRILHRMRKSAEVGP